MQNLLAVLKDLWEFVFKIDNIKEISTVETPLLPPRAIFDLLPVSTAETEEDLLITPTKIFQDGTLEKVVLYTGKEKANIFTRPVWTFDGVMMTAEYGTPVTVLSYEGRFAKVQINNTEGWIQKEDLIGTEGVFPTLKLGQVYLAEDQVTRMIRRYIKDEFFAEELFLPLQAVEFVLYRLKCQNRLIPWSTDRPRLPGLWQGVLKGKIGIKVSLEPTTGAIMEYYTKEGYGFIGYTQAVMVDATVRVETVGFKEDGQYSAESFTKEEWQACQAVWITIS